MYMDLWTLLCIKTYFLIFVSFFVYFCNEHVAKNFIKLMVLTIFVAHFVLYFRDGWTHFGNPYLLYIYVTKFS